MSDDLTIGYIVHDGTYAVVEDRTFVARCSNRQQAERVRAALSAADELAACRRALENIQMNVKGLADGMVPSIGPDAVWYFRNILATCNDALTAASPTTADHPYSLSLPEGRSVHVPCCDLPQSQHPSLGAPFSDALGGE